MNAVTSDYSDVTFNVGAPIISPNYLQTLDYNQVNLYSSYSEASSSTNLDTYSTSLNNKFNQNFSMGEYALSYKNMFSTSVSQSKMEKLFNYSYSVFFEYSSYSLSLPYYLSDLDRYTENLDANFLTALARLNSGTLSYEDFFNIYGTHMIANAIYGAACQSLYTVSSNYKELNNNALISIKSKFGDSIGNINENIDITNEIKESYEIKKIFFDEKFRSSSVGGNPFFLTDMNKADGEYNRWQDSITGREVLINFSNDGLIPIWEVLPTQYKFLKARMISEYNAYVSRSKQSCDDFFRVDQIVKPSIMINSVEQRIIDKNSDSYHNFADGFNLESEFFLDKNSLIKKGFNKIQVKVTLDMKEKQDGYQHVQLFDRICIEDPKTNWNNSGMLVEEVFDLGGSSVLSTYQTKNITFTLGLNQLTSNKMQLRYNAHGFAGDDWYKKDVRVGITISK